MAETRKLAAILAADVAGYSKLAGSDEERTLARLRALRSDLIDPTIAVHHGRVVKRTGDGSIIEFRSVVDAVRCAIEVQNGTVERNDDAALRTWSHEQHGATHRLARSPLPLASRQPKGAPLLAGRREFVDRHRSDSVPRRNVPDEGVGSTLASGQLGYPVRATLAHPANNTEEKKPNA